MEVGVVMNRQSFGTLVIASLILALLLITQCSDKGTDNNGTGTVITPVAGVATNITLSIYSDGWGTLLDSLTLATEGTLTIDIEEEQPYYDPPRYYIYARAENYYTELYNCIKGDTLAVDLDSVPAQPAAIAGTIFALQTYFTDCYWTEKDITITGPNGVSVTITTDEQGRFGRANLPTGTYTLSFACDQVPFSFEIQNNSGTDYEDLSFYEPLQAYAPNIYLYPEVRREISVKLGFPAGGQVTLSEPPYGDGWRVDVVPDGIIDGYYEYLFYEALLPVPLNHTNGWLLDGSDLADELRRLVEQLGFQGREVDDFVEYWTPRLVGSPWYAVYPQDVEAMITLQIDPAPKSLLRALFLIRALDRPLSIPEPVETEPFIRDGFTVVEWGVIMPGFSSGGH